MFLHRNGKIKMRAWLTCVLAAFCFQAQAVLPDTCIQDPQRSQACPRIIYKSADLPDPKTGKMSNRVICICLTDFQDLLIVPDNEVDRKIKQMRIQSWTAQLGISEETLKELIQY